MRRDLGLLDYEYCVQMRRDAWGEDNRDGHKRDRSRYFDILQIFALDAAMHIEKL